MTHKNLSGIGAAVETSGATAGIGQGGYVHPERPLPG